MSKLTSKKTSPPAKKATATKAVTARKQAKTTKAAKGSKVTKAAPPADSEPAAAPPVDAKWSGYLRVGSIVPETPHVKTFRLLPATGDRFVPFTFVPGQFLNVAFSIGGARMIRSYSISSSPTHREYVELTVRREPRGAVSRHIVDLLRVGDLVEAGGPVGNFTFTGTEADSIVLISAGVGVTPMVSIARYLTERSWVGDIFFFYACRTPADFIFADEIAALQRRHPKLRVAVTMTRPEGTDWRGPRGHLTKELLTQTVPELVSRRIHLCGPPSMMDATKALLAELGVPSEQVKTEAFGTPKPSPAAAGTTAKPTAPATGPQVTFSKNNKSTKIHPGQTILELSEELGIGIEFSCRVGTCGVCKVKMTSGEVNQEVQDSLDDDDKANNIILACQAKPKGEVTVEA
jgi:glycine betaine catabolism B